MEPLEAAQVVGFVPTASVNAGIGKMVTVIRVLAPSQLVALFTWLTHHEVLPGVVVAGVGASVSSVPPEAEVYHLRVWLASAVALSGVLASPTQ
jgi:hypothetical protein